MIDKTDTGYGFKALDPTGATYPQRHDGSNEMVYALPRPGEKWGPWMEHPDACHPDGHSCGAGRFHVWLSLSSKYGPRNWWPWFVQWENKIGGDERKIGVRRLRLRRIAPKVLHRALRLGWGKLACLRGANLYGADLRGANLYDADLRSADLRGANLCGADLYGADLRSANLCGADLRSANLCGANLCGADLYGASLTSCQTDKFTRGLK